MKPIIVAAAIGLLQISLIAPVAAQDGFVWTYDRYLDADPFQTYLAVTYGVPETDNQQFNARCLIGNRGTYAIIAVGANIGNYQDGADVDVQFTGRNFNHVVNGTVVGRNAEVGITGVEIPVQLDDDLWSGLAGLSRINYNLTGLPSLSMSLRGSSDAIGQFLDDCREMPSPDTDTAAAPPPRPVPSGGQADSSGVGALSCDVFGQLTSVSGGEETSINFVNNTEGFRAVMWLDYDGVPVPYANLNPGESYVQQTAIGHPWMITDGPGNCLEIYQPVGRKNLFEITAPNQVFGE